MEKQGVKKGKEERKKKQDPNRLRIVRLHILQYKHVLCLDSEINLRRVSRNINLNRRWIKH